MNGTTTKLKKHIGDRAACATCGQDIEWGGKDWLDRGGNRSCVPFICQGEIVQPAAEATHGPATTGWWSTSRGS